MGTRAASIAETAVELICNHGPQTFEELAGRSVSLGRTKARNPVMSVRASLSTDERFLTAEDGRLHLFAALLQGAIFSYRLSPLERRCEVVLVDGGDSLI